MARQLPINIVSAHDVEMLSQAISRIAEGNLSSSVPLMDGVLAPISRAVVDLRTNVTTEIELLQRQRALLNATLNGLSDGVMLFASRRLTYANRAASEMFGLRDPHVGLELDKLPLPTSVATKVKALLASETSREVNTEPDPAQRQYHLSSAQLGRTQRDGKATLIIAEDTTDRGRVDAMRKDFVVAASHELKTPASAIVLLADTALMATQDGDVAQAAEFVTQLRDEAHALQRLVADLLDLSRFEEKFDADAFADVRVAASNAIVSHRVAAEAKGLDLLVDFSEVGDVDVFVKMAPADLAIALDNLVDNAVAYTDEGSITISAEFVQSNVRIEVRDTGIGIESDEIERVFERFYRIDKSRSKSSGGTGLGLALVKHAVSRAGGTVRLGSSPGRGTTAAITLPRAT